MSLDMNDKSAADHLDEATNDIESARMHVKAAYKMLTTEKDREILDRVEKTLSILSNRLGEVENGAQA